MDVVVYAMKRYNGKKGYLINPCNLNSMLNYISWLQIQTGVFYNISIAPYKGRKYNPNFIWIVEG